MVDIYVRLCRTIVRAGANERSDVEHEVDRTPIREGSICIVDGGFLYTKKLMRRFRLLADLIGVPRRDLHDLQRFERESGRSFREEQGSQRADDVVSIIIPYRLVD